MEVIGALTLIKPCISFKTAKLTDALIRGYENKLNTTIGYDSSAGLLKSFILPQSCLSFGGATISTFQQTEPTYQPGLSTLASLKEDEVKSQTKPWIYTHRLCQINSLNPNYA